MCLRVLSGHTSAGDGGSGFKKGAVGRGSALSRPAGGGFTARHLLGSITALQVWTVGGIECGADGETELVVCRYLGVVCHVAGTAKSPSG